MVEKKLSDTIRGRILQSHLDGKSQRHIANEVGATVAQVKHLLKNYRETGSLNRKVGAGRKRKTSEHEDRLIIRTMKMHREYSAHEILQESGVSGISERTIRLRITEGGEFKSYWKGRKPFISEPNRVGRLRWATEHLNWTAIQWRRVLWSDESPFILSFQRKSRVWRLFNERYKAWSIRRTIKHEKKINVWGCCAAHGVGRLYRVEGILEKYQYNRILIHEMLPSAHELFPDEDGESWIFQQDNDPKHTARLNKEWVANNGIRTIDWPSQSPDLDPIENLWSILDQRCKKRMCNTENELMKVLTDAWIELPISLLAKLVDSMPHRCRLVIENNGNAIEYSMPFLRKFENS